MKFIRLAIIISFIFMFVMTIFFYPALPDRVVSHWNAAGQADGYISKFWGLGLIPLIMTACIALFTVIPRIDPLKMNYEKFRNYYEGFILLFILYLLAVQVQIILWSSGYQVSPNRTFPLLFGILFIYIGFLLEHAEQNWFVGIRTPWTLSSEAVWKKTHAIGGKLFKIAGIVSFVGLLFRDFAIWFILVPVLAVAVFTVAYSYFAFQKEKENSERVG
ncbi:MAG: SdpI family protein [Methanoregula sp.]|jgi:uncharacterized membrane protein